MQFVVPQFIDVEDKILGPLSVRQFIMSIVATGLLIAAFRLADFSLFLLEAFIIIIALILFAFIKVNGRPFHHFLINIVQMTKKPRLRVWNRMIVPVDTDVARVTTPPKQTTVAKIPLASSRLTELALVVDTGGVYKQEEYEAS